MQYLQPPMIAVKAGLPAKRLRLGDGRMPNPSQSAWADMA